ncbi:aminopeptidase [Nonomuraea sp. B19D2]|uniref:aminopeptidase n=1 Tax=Nonomuraea sp. B19D2 TaxID=3159561 RepID=UPI0032DB8D82
MFTTPDYRRVNGVVRATRPLSLHGTVIRDLELLFTDGVVTEVRASAGADVVRTHQASDPGVARLGELALVDGSSRVGESGITHLETLLDENPPPGVGSRVAPRRTVTPAFRRPRKARRGGGEHRHVRLVFSNESVNRLSDLRVRADAALAG